MGLLNKRTTAPAFSLQGTDGRTYSSESALGRGPLLVAFFKVSCPTCQYAFPFIERSYQQFREHGAQIWAISQDNARDSRSFIKEFGLTFPVLINDYPYEVADAYGIRYVPTLFLINPQGLIEIVSDGFAKGDLLAIQSWFGKYFAVSPPPLFRPSERVPEFKPG